MNRNTILKVWSVVEPKFQREFNLTETYQVLTHNKKIWGSWDVNPNTLTNFVNKCLERYLSDSNFQSEISESINTKLSFNAPFSLSKESK